MKKTKKPLCKLFWKAPVAQQRGRAVCESCSFQHSALRSDPHPFARAPCSVPWFPIFSLQTHPKHCLCFYCRNRESRLGIWGGSGHKSWLFGAAPGLFWCLGREKQGMCCTSSALQKTKRDKGTINRAQQWMREISPGGKTLLIWEPFVSKKQITLMANLFLWVAPCQEG